MKERPQPDFVALSSDPSNQHFPGTAIAAPISLISLISLISGCLSELSID
jgi:hypothetical protein